MERPMDNWNDERLDELSRRMDEGFKEMREGFSRIEQRFEKVATREEMGRLENRVDRLYYGCVTLLVLLIGSSVVNTFIG